MATFHKNLKYHEDTTPKHNMTLDEIIFLQNLQKEMNTQDHVCQADPRFWVIAGKDKIYRCDDDSAEDFCLYCSDDCDTVADNLNDAIEFINEKLKNMNRNAEIQKSKYGFCFARDYYESGTAEIQLPTIIDFNRWLNNTKLSQYELVGYRIIDKTYSDTMFLTEKDAAEHLKLNQHNYDSEAHTYAMTAVRSPRVEQLYKILQTVDFEKLKQTIQLK